METSDRDLRGLRPTAGWHDLGGMALRPPGSPQRRSRARNSAADRGQRRVFRRRCVCPRQGHKAHVAKSPGVQVAGLILLNAPQHLIPMHRTHGDHQAAAGSKLLNEHRRDLGRRGGHDDRVEWRMFRPSQPAITRSNRHRVAQLPQPLARGIRKLRQRLDAPDMRCDVRQHCCLVSRPGADLQHAAVLVQAQGLRHQGNDIRLRDRLVQADRQRRVLIGGVLEFVRDEQMPGHRGHGIQHRGFGNVRPPGRPVRTRRCHGAIRRISN